MKQRKTVYILNVAAISTNVLQKYKTIPGLA